MIWGFGAGALLLLTFCWVIGAQSSAISSGAISGCKQVWCLLVPDGVEETLRKTRNSTYVTASALSISVWPLSTVSLGIYSGLLAILRHYFRLYPNTAVCLKEGPQLLPGTFSWFCWLLSPRVLWCHPTTYTCACARVHTHTQSTSLMKHLVRGGASQESSRKYLLMAESTSAE